MKSLTVGCANDLPQKASEDEPQDADCDDVAGGYRSMHVTDSSPTSPPTSRADPEAGFTLLELLIVVAILGLLVAVATPQLMKVLGGAKQDAARLSLDGLGQSLDLYKLDVGAYPTTTDGLEALWTKPSGANGWRGPYVKSQSQLLDPWGKPFTYASPSDALPYRLTSLGEDGVPGGEDEAADISSPK